ncbi:MAG: MinD/ParA family protein [Actinobacteria bacterium]|nr:MinD/ParA family protein [Actinomycetota bacterium]
MTKILSVHSFRGGTGKSNTSANIAARLAASGRRVAVVDTDVQSPGIHVLFGFDEHIPGPTLNDYLYGSAPIADTAHDVTDRITMSGATVREGGALFLVPASIRAGDIARVLRQGYDVEVLNDGFRELVKGLALDHLIIDTHPGLNEETLLSITISDTLLLIMRPDKQDYQGTAVTVDIARRLEVPELLLMVNKVPSNADPVIMAEDVSEAYDVEVAGVLPLSEDIVTNASGGLFSLTDPDHDWSRAIASVVDRLAR